MGTAQWFSQENDPTGAANKVLCSNAKSCTEKSRCQIYTSLADVDEYETSVDMYIPSDGWSSLFDQSHPYESPCHFNTIHEVFWGFGSVPTAGRDYPIYGGRLSIRNVFKPGENSLLLAVSSESMGANEGSGAPYKYQLDDNNVQMRPENGLSAVAFPFDKWVTIHVHAIKGDYSHGTLSVDITYDGLKRVVYENKHLGIGCPTCVIEEGDNTQTYAFDERAWQNNACSILPIKMYQRKDFMEHIARYSSDGTCKIYWKNAVLRYK